MASRAASLISAFDIGASVRVIALVGAGGKTSCMFRLAAELSATGRRVVTTTTTKIYSPHPDQSPALLLLEKDPLDGLPELMALANHVTVGKKVLPNGKLDAISEHDLNEILPYTDLVLIEADGSAGRCVKAPEAWEPVIPTATDVVIPVVGLDCIGRPATEETVFRLHRFLQVTGMEEKDLITSESLARLFSSPVGLVRGVPPHARVVPLLNKLDRLGPRHVLGDIARRILSWMQGRATRIVAACLTQPAEIIIYEVGPDTGPAGPETCS